MAPAESALMVTLMATGRAERRGRPAAAAVRRMCEGRGGRLSGSQRLSRWTVVA